STLMRSAKRRPSRRLSSSAMLGVHFTNDLPSWMNLWPICKSLNSVGFSISLLIHYTQKQTITPQKGLHPVFMQKSLLLAFVAAALLCGCSTRYEITLTNSDRVTAFSKPKRVDGQYVFKDATGQERRVSTTRVIQ